MSTRLKTLCVLGSLLLLCMGLFHGSGMGWITGELSQSNAQPFLKAVFPVLFIHVSIQLIGLSALGFLLLRLRAGIRVIAAFIAAMVSADMLLALWLQAYPPALVLFLAAACFVLVAVRS